MHIEPKLENVICIKFGENENIILSTDDNKTQYDLNTGLLIGSNNYGFVLITDHNGIQKEKVYPTQNRISAIYAENGILRIFEEGKNKPWVFNKSGILNNSPFNDFKNEFIADFIANIKDLPNREPIFKNPLNIKLNKNPKQSVILKDENNEKDFPLYPGVMLGNEHYGFILIIDIDNVQKEICFPTQNRISAVGIENFNNKEFKIYENGKYNPWIFSFDGKLKEEASYNPHSRRDIKFIEDVYKTNIEEATKKYALKIKNN